MSRNTDRYYRLFAASDRPRVHAATPLPGALSFQRGSALPATVGPQLPEFEVDLKGARQFPHWLDGDALLVSRLLLDTLTKAGVDNYQAFPARVKGASHLIALNILGLVDAADLEASRFVPASDGVNGPLLLDFQELVLSRKKTGDFALFRLLQDPACVLTHEGVMRELTRLMPEEGWGFDPLEIRVA